MSILLFFDFLFKPWPCCTLFKWMHVYCTYLCFLAKIYRFQSIARFRLQYQVHNLYCFENLLTCWYNDGLKNSVMTVYSAGLGKCLVSMKKDKVTFTFIFIQMFLPYKYIRTYLRLYRHIESCKHSCSF